MPVIAARPRALVTGSSGFVGVHLVQALLAQGWRVRCSTRKPVDRAPRDAESFVALDVGPGTDWQPALDEIDVVFHLANRAHVLKEHLRDPAAEFERVNVGGTAQLARCARIAGVRRLVYVSSIGVHGDNSEDGVLTESSPIRPHNAYARSKARAEEALQSEAGKGLDFVVVRPPLIYGAAVPGNFRRLLRLIASGLPIPLASIRNRRSYAAVDNVVGALLCCGSAAAAAGQSYVVADGEDFSTPDLIRRLAGGMGMPARLLPFPLPALRAAARITGMQYQLAQLCGTLQVNAAKLRKQLGWKATVDAREALAETARWYARSR